jgi:hypothetical protein
VNSRRWTWLIGELRKLGKRHAAISTALGAALDTAPRPVGLVVASGRRVDDVGELSPVQRKQLRISGKRYDGRDLDAAARLTPLVNEGDPGFSFVDHREIVDAAGKPAFDVLSYMADSGTIFRAGSTTVIGDIVQGGVSLLAKDDALRTALQVAVDTPLAKKSKRPAKAKKKR